MQPTHGVNAKPSDGRLRAAEAVAEAELAAAEQAKALAAAQSLALRAARAQAQAEQAAREAAEAEEAALREAEQSFPTISFAEQLRQVEETKYATHPKHSSRHEGGSLSSVGGVDQIHRQNVPLPWGNERFRQRESCVDSWRRPRQSNHSTASMPTSDFDRAHHGASHSSSSSNQNAPQPAWTGSNHCPTSRASRLSLQEIQAEEQVSLRA